VRPFSTGGRDAACPFSTREGGGRVLAQLASRRSHRSSPSPPPRTNLTHLVPPPVQTGHAASSLRAAPNGPGPVQLLGALKSESGLRPAARHA